MEPRSIEAIEADIAATRERIAELERQVYGAQAQIRAWREEAMRLGESHYPAGKLDRLRGELANARRRRAWDTYPRYQDQHGREWCVVSIGAKQGKVCDGRDPPLPGHHPLRRPGGGGGVDRARLGGRVGVAVSAPFCHRLLAARTSISGDEYLDATKAPGVRCIGSACAMWVPQLSASTLVAAQREFSPGDMIDRDPNSGTTYRHVACKTTGLGWCADNPRATPWADPAKEGAK